MNRTQRIIIGVVYLCLAVLFFSTVQLPYKVALPLTWLAVASWWCKLSPWMTAALAFSAIGDAFGAAHVFLAQMGAFACAHVCYIVFFCNQEKKKESMLPRLVRIFLALLYGVLIITYLLPFVPAGVLTAGVTLYCCLILIMLLMAMRSSNGWFTLGALLFVFSDSVLAINKFAIDIPYSIWLIMVSYYAGQYLLFAAKSLSKNTRK